jgi:hypothetical protein
MVRSGYVSLYSNAYAHQSEVRATWGELDDVGPIDGDFRSVFVRMPSDYVCAFMVPRGITFTMSTHNTPLIFMPFKGAGQTWLEIAT